MKYRPRVARMFMSFVLRALRALLCLLTEYTMSEGGRAVIWHLVSAPRAARHPKDSRTNC